MTGVSLRTYQITQRYPNRVSKDEATKELTERLKSEYSDHTGIVPVDLIEYGDPDGQGDLRRLDQYALRATITTAKEVR